MYKYIYIYIYIERERERERGTFWYLPLKGIKHFGDRSTIIYLFIELALENNIRSSTKIQENLRPILEA